MGQGSFIISLDFELHWGVRDILSPSDSKDHFLRARAAIPEVLLAFEEHEVHATWATVGFLFARNKRHLLDHLPEVRPRYTERQLDPYLFLDEIGEDERSDPLHYATSLLHAIAEVPGQEIASHTFSHYYCLEDGQTEQAFEADLCAAAAIGEPFGRVTEALVFPRGQYNPDYDSVLARLGVRTYRVPPAFHPYRPRPADEENPAPFRAAALLGMCEGTARRSRRLTAWLADGENGAAKNSATATVTSWFQHAASLAADRSASLADRSLAVRLPVRWPGFRPAK